LGNNLDKYDRSFIETFGLEKNMLAGLKYQDIKEWDSVGHMNLIGEIEDAFNIELDIDDITDLSSYEEGKKILKRYKVKF
tara:strand:+ start:234 stop:473 length:240 start_codon:yes stop_codon:yes gene_type:complete